VGRHRQASHDGATFGLVTLFLAVTALAASYLPARREE